MEEVINYMKQLISDMEPDQWSIVGIVDVEEFTDENDLVWGKVDDDVGIYQKQDVDYIRQWTGYAGDDYSGFILKPLEGNKYLKISYSC